MPHVHAASGSFAGNPSIRSEIDTRPIANQSATSALRFTAGTSSSMGVGEVSDGDAQRRPGLSQSSFTNGANSSSALGTTAINSSNFGEGARWDDIMQSSSYAFDYSTMLPAVNDMDPFSGFDIPFWLDQDQNWGVLHEWQ